MDAKNKLVGAMLSNQIGTTLGIELGASLDTELDRVRALGRE
jgi:hypothetical protein